ncbi:MAG: alpha/beta hydrolase [Hyphomicrobiaceae bacterium]|nr:alpha/beta hydrolase [Hyphomicrobiaceae bacterium]
MVVNFLKDGAQSARTRILLAHGAGAPMDTPFMAAFAEGLAQRGFAVARFEFVYMAERRCGGKKRPPPRAERLLDEFADAITALGADDRLIIGGKSLGGRVASMIAQQEYDAGRIAGLVCLGYPFHPPGRPEKLRTAHLMDLSLPVMIAQGTRDPFGGRDDVPGYGLPASFTIHWAEDGDHNLVPRKRSGRSPEQNWAAACDAVAGWEQQLTDSQ